MSLPTCVCGVLAPDEKWSGTGDGLRPNSENTSSTRRSCASKSEPLCDIERRLSGTGDGLSPNSLSTSSASAHVTSSHPPIGGGDGVRVNSIGSRSDASSPPNGDEMEAPLLPKRRAWASADPVMASVCTHGPCGTGESASANWSASHATRRTLRGVTLRGNAPPASRATDRRSSHSIQDGSGIANTAPSIGNRAIDGVTGALTAQPQPLPDVSPSTRSNATSPPLLPTCTTATARNTRPPMTASSRSLSTDVAVELRSTGHLSSVQEAMWGLMPPVVVGAVRSSATPVGKAAMMQSPTRSKTIEARWHRPPHTRQRETNEGRAMLKSAGAWGSEITCCRRGRASLSAPQPSHVKSTSGSHVRFLCSAWVSRALPPSPHRPTLASPGPTAAAPEHASRVCRTPHAPHVLCVDT
eukprot:Opistho-2@65673